MTGESQDELRHFIDEWLQSRHLGLSDLARTADVSYVTLYKFMKGKRTGYSVLNRLASAMDVSPEHLHRLGGLLPSAVEVARAAVRQPDPAMLERIERRLGRMTQALGMSQVDVFRVAGLLDEPELAHDELAGVARLLARIPDSERDRIVHALEAMLEQLGASYVESSGDPDDHATDEHGRAGGSGA